MRHYRIFIVAMLALPLVSLFLGPMYAAAPAAWATPRTNYATGNRPSATEFNAVETNIGALGNGFTGTNGGCSTGNITRNNTTTLTNVTGAAFAIGANENWDFEFYIHLNGSSAAADYNFAVTFPAATTGQHYGLSKGPGALSTTTNGETSTAGGRVGLNGSAVDETVILSGHVRNGANAGNIQLQVSQDTATAIDTIVYPDTCARGWRTN